MPVDAVLAAAAESALASGTRMLDPHAVKQECARRGVTSDQWIDAIVALREARLVQAQVAEPVTVVLLAIANAGLLQHLAASRPDLDDVRVRLAAAVTKATGQGGVRLHEWIGEPALLVECLLDEWVSERKVVYSLAPGRRFRIHRARL